MIESSDQAVTLTSPTALPKAGSFLWNRRMLLQITARGYAQAQAMWPDPVKFATGPAWEGKTFMQPEQNYYAHHPGRFFYLQDRDRDALCSLPYEPVRASFASFRFRAETDRVQWQLGWKGLELNLSVQLPEDDPVELWQLTLHNPGNETRRLKLVPYIPLGYRSWMAQSAQFDETLNGVLSEATAPYQRLQDYPDSQAQPVYRYLLADQAPSSWSGCRVAFEGEGGLHNPDALRQAQLDNQPARYDEPLATMQFEPVLPPGGRVTLRFAIGMAKQRDEIETLRQRYLMTPEGFEQAQAGLRNYLSPGKGRVQAQSPDPELDRFSNLWLPRQIHYHVALNRMTGDPQTRNYLQDWIGANTLTGGADPQVLINALSQQHASGEMPDGIRLHEQAQLQYINQVPHTDHGIWLPLALKAYLDESNDYALLDQDCPFADGSHATVAEHLDRAMQYHLAQRDERGLCYIQQGDWCDPMNMVGHKGKGVSGWLTLALAYALRQWAEILAAWPQPARAEHYQHLADQLNQVANAQLWDGHWYARGINDEGHAFGVASNHEGRIYLNPQSWALLSGAPDPHQAQRLLASVDEQLGTPYGVQMLAPAYTGMNEGIGRLTQKYPGTGENGSIYNHAAMFWVYALYQQRMGDQAFSRLRELLPGTEPETAQRHGQLPLFLPNYYRGAFSQYPDSAGRSSGLFQTGTAAWYGRILMEQLYGLRGERQGLRIDPQLPSHWPEARVTRDFRGAIIEVHYRRDPHCEAMRVCYLGQALQDNLLQAIQPGSHYPLEVVLPEAG
ncbi:GH36-type glycosyl hydrolase domain-containing protein [Ferrimonas marina]|uniref:Cellobionic acid phosphorylase n=1 Tax=Ferrimonas marina TaxID=299255 RepID=A0A1M5NQP9_9GAMM|nr:hypothetical protein [Ferrimonas marina]SHG91886.1 cellobionic acid phosphorylase [Ferrimonas marina]